MAREEAGPKQETAVVDWGQRRRARSGSPVVSEGKNGPRAGGAGGRLVVGEEEGIHHGSACVFNTQQREQSTAGLGGQRVALVGI